MEFLIFCALVLGIVALVRAGGARKAIDLLASRVAGLESEVRRLRDQLAGLRAASEPPPAPAPEPAPAPAAPPPLPAAPPRPATPITAAEISEPPARPAAPEPASRLQQWMEGGGAAPSSPAASPGPLPPASPPPSPINWEQFMGAKLFAWIGGLALFLGVAFFVKYSFEHNLIPPEARVAIGFLIGIGLLVGGVMMKRQALAVTAQTLCATGVLILYATTFACRAFYRFPFFGLLPTLLLMTLITAVAFLLAVRLEAQVVAVLGMLGGFLTPVLLSTGQDNPWGLFGYIALIDAGLIAVALHRRWLYLVPLGAVCTAFMQIGWAARFFVSERYFEGNKVVIPMLVEAGFVALFLGAAFWAKRHGRTNRQLTWSALGLAGVAFCFALSFLAFTPLAQRPLLLFSYVFLIDLGVLALVLLDKELATVQPVSGLAVFLMLAIWTGNSMNDALLNSGLALYLVFTIFHSVVPLALQRLRAIAVPAWWSQTFPALALLLALVPVLQTTALSFLVWPFVLLVDLLAVVLAVLSATLLPILLVLVLTLLVAAVWIFRIPATLSGLPTTLWVVGGFAVFFLVASVWAARRLARHPAASRPLRPAMQEFMGAWAGPESLKNLLPACSVVLPFLLLIMVTARLPITNPSPVFGLALLLVVLVLGVSRLLAVEALPLVGLLSVVALENAWQAARFDPANAAIPLGWYLVFYAVFTAFPFVFRKDFTGKALPWAAAAISGPLHFYLVHRLLKLAWPNPMMGLVPAAFAVPSILALVALVKSTPAGSPARQTQLAWFGGVALFFITLIFPIQFDRQWITIGWALEGVALCWLFHRIAHPGLRLVGVGLLVVAFARLALNPAVLSYHARSPVAIFNWYLYAYGLVSVCLFAGARLLAPPHHVVFRRNAPPLLCALGTVLAFLLVNIEIADYFTTPGAPVVTFEFSGNLARDMSYSMAWALFALLLLIIGIAKKLPAVRYAGIGLLSVTLLKLFLHDLAQLDALYRIGALVVVAIVAILASFLYQRFLAIGDKPDETTPPPPLP
ncbi:MAG: hypothetical protein QOE70_5079 [Chthoniobacter sp.]|jgi:hypothetical protein|nr:hypothetical protein [Chthoniobacter sp.]